MARGRRRTQVTAGLFGPLRLTGSAPPPARLGEGKNRILLSLAALGGGDVEVRDRGGSENGDRLTSVRLSAVPLRVLEIEVSWVGADAVVAVHGVDGLHVLVAQLETVQI